MSYGASNQAKSLVLDQEINGKSRLVFKSLLKYVAAKLI